MQWSQLKYNEIKWNKSKLQWALLCIYTSIVSQNTLSVLESVFCWKCYFIYCCFYNFQIQLAMQIYRSKQKIRLENCAKWNENKSDEK